MLIVPHLIMALLVYVFDVTSEQGPDEWSH